MALASGDQIASNFIVDQDGYVQVKLSGTQTVNATPTPSVSGGLLTYRKLASADTNLATPKASAGQLYGWYVYNNSASAKFLKIYNKASNPTLASDTPVLTIPVPATSKTEIAIPSGIALSAGLAIAATGAVGDTDTTALAANDLIINLFYK
jgi:hypothetical protein